MKKQIKLATIALLGIVTFSITSCKKDKTPIIEERSELIFTKVTGTGVVAHSDHFDGLGGAVEGTKTVIKFDKNGTATSGGHLHLDPDGIYKIELKTWDNTGKEIQNDFIANKATADNYKAFLVGGSFVLNVNSPDEEGAIFQPRETTYGDGTAVTGSGGIGTTGIISYFIVGHDNEGEKDVTFVLRKLNSGVKATITRKDWNRNDYATAFGGSDVLKLKFEIHAEH